ncbi:hypothetical protein jhhlp_004196 [Lomentospora prolificans]|uniref:Uncharacterized protein n=1 Tax=Lomentospora prolificans TaxID=41688 RepID=A0A2N3NAX4_9PEZI|nr:hypothetical protein jhhlp_004196 [Lomentospora prolificans]
MEDPALHVVASFHHTYFRFIILFISGCAIQQRTLREIRQGIKAPKPSPKIYLPDRFKHTTTELEDGTIVIINDQPVVPIQQRQAPAVVTITPTEEAAQEASETPAQDGLPLVFSDVYGPLPKGVQRQKKVEEPTTERERNLRQQLEKNQKHPDPLKADQKLLSRAERRKLIKDEIKRLSHVEGPAYQRRLW